MASATTLTNAPAQRKRGRLSKRGARQATSFYIFIAPWLLGFLLLTVVPMLVGLYLSLTNYDGLNWFNLKFVGIQNYQRIFADDDAMRALRNTLLWTALNTPLWITLSFLLAYMLNQAINGRSIFRVLLYLPSIIPVVVVARAWGTLLHPSYGLVNKAINIFIPGTQINWLIDYALLSITAVSVWTGIGTGVVLFLAALQDIPTELEEAAMIDGASRVRVFRHIIIPLMTPVIFFQVIQSIIAAMQFFAIPVLLSPYGGNQGILAATPAQQVYLYMVHTVRQIFGAQRYGYGVAMIWFLIVLIIAFTAALFWTQRYWVYYASEPEEK